MSESEIRKEIIKSTQAVIVELFTIDMTPVGGEVLRFTNTSNNGEPITFGGETYLPLPIQVTGFEWGSKGTLPRPTLTVFMKDMELLSKLVEFDGFIGREISRIKTFEKYLDGKPEANSNAHFPVEVYVINQKTSQTKMQVDFTLASPIDIEGMSLPRQIVAKDFCPHRYREYYSSGFDYDRATCPYTGSTYYDVKGEEVFQPHLDQCGKTLEDCKLRFGADAVLPFLGFPGIHRF